MTSPPSTTTTEVIASMATTAIHGDNPPNLNLTADTPPATESDAPASHEVEDSGIAPAEEEKEEEQGQENTAKDAGEEQAHPDTAPTEDAPPPNHDGLPRDFEVDNQEQQIVEEQPQQDSIRPEDAAIPQLNQDGLSDGFALADPAQIAGLDALIAMGQMEQLGYNPNMALAQAAGLDMPMLPMPNEDHPWLEHAAYPPDVNRPEDRLVGYAKLVFEDGEFYMNTHSVILGRDPTAHRAAQRREKEEAKRKVDAETPGPRTPVQIKREHYSKSVFSEKSGILREGNDSDEETREKRRLKRKASKKSKSTGSSHELSRRNSLAQQPPKPHVYEAQYPARIKEENAVPVDPATLRPDPNECPLIPLHPSGNAPASAYKSISREHVKIAYNFNKATFEMHIYGRNGAFVNEVYHPQNSVVDLKSGNVLQIGQVPLEFVLPDGIIDNGQVQYDDELAADRRSAGGKEMSFDFEDDRRHGVPEDSSSEPVSNDGGEDEGEEGEEEMEEDGEEIDVDEDEDAQEMSDLDHDQPGLIGSVEEDEIEQEEEEPQPEFAAPSGKKRGPGRPPKNGIMSAREEREQKAALKAAGLGNQKGQKSQKSVAQPVSTTTPEKKKVGRPRKHDKPDPTEPEKPKRKYTKRKPKESKDGEAKQEGSDGEDQATKEKKEKKAKPPRSPSPTFVESELTPEQLQKPQANYVTLIFEALSNSKEGKLGLPQIYRAIQRKYPYFVLKVGTLGWQSSVRHNLSQHHAFEKVERDGKGWMWGIVKGVSIEKEKKRRTPPPPNFNGMHHQPIYQAGQQHYMGGYPPQYGPHPGYMPHQMMHGPPPPGQHGHPQQYMGPPPHMNGHPPPPNNQPPPKPINPGLAAAMIPQLNSNRSYSSPYAPTAAPAPPAEPQSSEQPTPTEQRQPPTQEPAAENTSQGAQPQPQPQPPQIQSSTSHQIKDQTPPTQHSQLHERPPRPAAPQQQAAPPTPNHMPELPQHSQQVITATETFKERMLQSFKDPQGEEILNSAVNQVLGYTHESSLPGNKYEEGIIKHLRSMLEKLPGNGFNAASSISPPSNPERVPTPQTNGQHTLGLSLAATNQSETQASASSTPQPNKTSGADKPTPTVMRPTFTGQGQSRLNVTRPPMGTPGVKRESGSPARMGAEGQIVGQKRGLDEPEDYKDVKRLNGAGMSPLRT